MTFEVRLPDIGEGIAEGEVVRWLVKAGDAVREDQPLVEVMTDKASVEIPSPRTGTIEALHAEEGARVPVGSLLLTIAVAGAAASTAPARTAAPASTAAVAAAAPVAPAAARAPASPAVRQLAKSLGVELAGLAGSGPGGAITANDVQHAAAGGAGAGPRPGAPPAAGGGGPAPGATPAPVEHAPAPKADEPEERVPLRGLRRRIAEHMRHSLDTAAHFTFVAEADFTALVLHRDALRARAEATGARLTYLAYVFRALPGVLARFPRLNASLDDARGEVVLKRYVHLGLATMTDDGLTVPVVRHADRLGLFALAREIERLAGAARAGSLKLEELQGGTFTVTSTGAHGGVLATPILHHPQVGILGVHEVKPRPAVVDGAIVARDLTHLSLTLDHRVVDGAVGADFLYALIETLERPQDWLSDADLA